MLLLHTSALRLDEIDSRVLQLYDKYKVPYDIYTYQNLSKMYLNLRDYDMVKKLYRR